MPLTYSASLLLTGNKNETCESTHLKDTSNKIQPISITSSLFSSNLLFQYQELKFFQFFYSD